jgi:hypothetical protein
MHHTYLPLLEAHRESRLLAPQRNQRGQLKIEGAPPTGSSGHYWIFTNYSHAELKACTPSSDRNAIDIAKLATLHERLAHICDIAICGYRLVYNGVAGPGCGIRERLGQHFNGGAGTGCLSIGRSSLTDLSRWRVSYASFATSSGAPPDLDCDFDVYAKDLERMWRLQYGWPLLCRV